MMYSGAPACLCGQSNGCFVDLCTCCGKGVLPAKYGDTPGSRICLCTLVGSRYDFPLICGCSSGDFPLHYRDTTSALLCASRSPQCPATPLQTTVFVDSRRLDVDGARAGMGPPVHTPLRCEVVDARVYVCISGSLKMCVCMCVYGCVCMCVYVYVYMCACVYVYVCVCVDVCVYMCVYVYVSMCVYVCVYVYVSMCVYVCMYMSVCTCVCV